MQQSTAIPTTSLQLTRLKKIAGDVERHPHSGYPAWFRAEVVAALASGVSVAEAARVTQVTDVTLRKWWADRLAQGTFQEVRVVEEMSTTSRDVEIALGDKLILGFSATTPAERIADIAMALARRTA